MGVLGKLISTVGILQRALGVPVSILVIPFFVVLGGSAMSVCRPFVFFGRSLVQIVHSFLLLLFLPASTGTANPPQRDLRSVLQVLHSDGRSNKMSEQNSVVAIYPSHDGAEEAVKELQRGGIDMKTLSIVGKDTHTDEHAVGYYNAGDRMKYWGKAGAFWGGFWGLLFGSAFFVIPGIGPLLVAGPMVAWIVAALEGAVVVGGLSAIGAGLYSLGIPKDSIVNYELALKTDKYLLMVHGTASEVGKAREIIQGTHPVSVELHAGKLVTAAG
jgi:uncharacterized membrane protein